MAMPLPALPHLHDGRVEIAVIAIDLSPVRSHLLEALLYSLRTATRRNPLRISLIGDEDCRPFAERHGIERVVSPSDILDADPDDAPVPNWYLEQLVALAYPAGHAAGFVLMLPIGAFAVTPLTEAILLPDGLALTTYEPVAFHPEWWDWAHAATGRTPLSQWSGPSILPALIHSDLAAWTLDVVGREQQQSPLAFLRQASAEAQPWSALSLYATASGSRFAQMHVDAKHATDQGSYQLLSGAMLWSASQEATFDPAAARRSGDRGLFSYVQSSEAKNLDRVLDRLFCSLNLEG